MPVPSKRNLVLETIQKYPDLSDHAIAKLAGVSALTVGRHRDKPQPERREASGRRARGRKPWPKTEEQMHDEGFIPEATVYYCYEKPVRGYAILLYIGCSMQVIKRIASHDYRTPWWREVHTIRLEHYPTVAAALMAETRAIRRRQPKYNIRYKFRGVTPPRRI